MGVINFIMNRIIDFFNLLSSTEMFYGMTWWQFIIGSWFISILFGFIIRLMNIKDEERGR